MHRNRRKYAVGTCQDCGWQKRVTEIIFWLNGMRYRVCKDCIKPYRDRILKPCEPNCPVCQSDASRV